ncbi:uncharacterized protein LOC132719610 [Ruditapes philippinarum]|uniref:uncharacterized protein LOC132719610 n=1 Tax=Ruditapes philippinarum TaxID=129788 RepID=UPI00295B6183|nr:uncharacterized protein LOC132719610 [Ruditapes philippinarum]
MALGLYLGIGLTWKPWRQPYENFKWNKETAEKLQNDVYDIKPTAEWGLKNFKALTIGLCGHGKSSLINSFASISVGEKTTVCDASPGSTLVTTHVSLQSTIQNHPNVLKKSLDFNGVFVKLKL